MTRFDASSLVSAEAANALLDAVYDAIPLGLAFFSPEGRFERVNQALADMNGMAVEAHLGRSIEEVLGEEGSRITGYVHQVAETRRALVDQQIAIGVPGEPGGVRYWEAGYFPVLDPAGELVGVGAVVREVTERHRAEDERARLLKEAVTARAHAEAALLRAEGAQRVAELERSRMEFLAEVGRRMADSMDYPTTLQGVAESAVPILGDWCVITIAEPDGRLEPLAAAHSDPAKVELLRDLTERYPSRLDEPSAVTQAILTGEVLLLGEIPAEMLEEAARDEEHLRVLHGLGLQSVLVVPLRTPERTLGALSLAFAESGRRFTDADVSLAVSLAARSALHIRNAQLYTERSHIARTLQAGLLPSRLPEIPGLEVAARYQAAGDQNDVGGDFYDVFPTREDGVWVALIGDVSGKGPEAAALTSLTRHTLRTASLQHQSPAENLHVLNRALLADTTTTRFSTVLYARLCPGASGARVTVAGGGHPGPLILRAGGELERVDVRGTLVGGVADPEFGERDLRLEPGDLMLLYTDGVTELRTRDPLYGDRRLAETLRGLTGASAEQVVEEVRSMAVGLQDGPPRDDIAVLAIKVSP